MRSNSTEVSFESLLDKEGRNKRATAREGEVE